MVRVIFELTDVGKGDGGTIFIPGSHKRNFPMVPEFQVRGPLECDHFT
jgi:ectoine hydroxylase-related dioxygenase (phytanoyl-CoA dioxygenase family)